MDSRRYSVSPPRSTPGASRAPTGGTWTPRAVASLRKRSAALQAGSCDVESASGGSDPGGGGLWQPIVGRKQSVGNMPDRTIIT